MSDNNTQEQMEVEKFVAETDNFAEQLRSLKARVTAVGAQASNELLRVDSAQVEGELQFELGSLPMTRQFLEESITFGLAEFQRVVQCWRETTQESMQRFVNDVEGLEARVGNNQEQDNGLVSTDIAQQQIDDESKNSCSVCIDDFKLEESVKKCLGCQKYFHDSCLKKWFANKPNCPLCRKNFRIFYL